MPDEPMPWRPATFLRGVPGGKPAQEQGYEWRGLALYHLGWATPRTETRWVLLHLGSGGALMYFTGDVRTVMPIAAEIAECSDWEAFSLPGGWQQTDPDMPAKVAAICNAHPEARADTGGDAPMLSDDDARAVIEAREAGRG